MLPYFCRTLKVTNSFPVRQMHPKSRKSLAERVDRAAQAALGSRKNVSPIDVLVGIGWLDPGAVKRWRQGQIDHLWGVVQVDASRILQAMSLFQSWASARGLLQNEVDYVAGTPQ